MFVHVSSLAALLLTTATPVPLFVHAAAEPAPEARSDPGHSADRTVVEGEVLRGVMSVQRFHVPEGITAFVDEDFEVLASDSIRIEGRLEVSGDEARTAPAAPSLTLSAGALLEITGTVEAVSAHLGVQTEGPGLASGNGRPGTDIVLQAPVILVDGVVRAGPGEQGSSGRQGGKGGSVLVIGQTLTRTTGNGETGIFGGAGGAGGPVGRGFRDGLPGGDGGDVLAVEPPEGDRAFAEFVLSTYDLGDLSAAPASDSGPGSSFHFGPGFDDPPPICISGAKGADAGFFYGGPGGMGSPGTAGTPASPNGGVGGVGGNGGVSIGTKGGDGLDGADCCSEPNVKGGRGGAGGIGCIVTGGVGGTGGTGGAGYVDPSMGLYGKGGKGGRGGRGGAATGGGGGDGGDGGDGTAGGGSRGAGGAPGGGFGGFGGRGGAGGAGWTQGLPGNFGPDGGGTSGAPGSAGQSGSTC